MRFVALAVDYDGTLARHGEVAEETYAALERLRSSGRQAILVTGRQLDDLSEVLGERLKLFSRVVAENGAVLYAPANRQTRTLADPPPNDFAERLRERGVDPLSQGEVVIATHEPNETAVLEVIRELGLELQIAFNKGAVMVLPAGVTKRSGLQAALDELGLAWHNVVGVGDAENDHAFLGACECAVAVANAIPALQESADLVTAAPHGEGVQELIARLLADDLASLEPRLKRHRILFGKAAKKGGKRVRLAPYGSSLLALGSQKSGKSTLTLGLLERLTAAAYQYCLLDPEGDYETLPGAVNLGTPERVPMPAEVLEVLAQPTQNVVVSLLAVAAEDRPDYLVRLLPPLAELRARTGRPHWLIVDEAHHVLPAQLGPAHEVMPQAFGGLVLVAPRARLLSPAALTLAREICCMGEDPSARLAEFCVLVGEDVPEVPHLPKKLKKGEGLFWTRGTGRARLVEIEPATLDRKRHRRKYAEGDLGEELSFYFRGPEDRLNLRAQNLQVFMHLGDGVDDETWLHHLRAGDYSAWVKGVLKDKKLMRDLRAIERADPPYAADESRAKVRAAIEARYAPAGE